MNYKIDSALNVGIALKVRDKINNSINTTNCVG
jgi:hypothetical protein